MDYHFDFSQIHDDVTYQKFIGDSEWFIDSGANGEVYRALINGALAIAVKKIVLSQANYEKEIEALDKETGLLMNLNHPNIVKVYFRFNCICKNKRTYIFGMEYIPRNLLSILSTKNQLSDYEVALMAKDLNSALSHLQEKGVSHRDIKPANILVTNDGRYKLCDFSEFKQQEPSLQTTKQNTLRGSPSYLAPELKYYLIHNTNQEKFSFNTVKADVFSYGLVLLQSLLGLKNPEVQFGQLNISQQKLADALNKHCTSSYYMKNFLKSCLYWEAVNRPSFLQLNSYFSVNIIEAFFMNIEKNQQIKLFNDALNKTKQYEQEIKNLNAKIKSLDALNKTIEQQFKEAQKKHNEEVQRLYAEIEALKKEKQDQPIIQQQSKKQKNIKKDDEQIKNLFKENMKKLRETVKTGEELKKQLAKNSNLKFKIVEMIDKNIVNIEMIDKQKQFEIDIDYIVKYQQYIFNFDMNIDFYMIYNFYNIFEKFWNNESGQKSDYSTYWRFADGETLFIDEQDIQNAIGIVKKMQQETGYKFSSCLKVLHSNFWNYEKSKNDLLY